jgi:hypothetical protein
MGVSRYTRPFPWYTNAKPLLAEHDPGMFQSLLARWLEFEDVEFSYGIQLASGGLVQYGAALDASSVPIAAMPEYQMRFVDRLRAVQQKGHGKKLRVRRPGELAIYASKPGVRSNYGHFLIETLPALLDLTRHPPAGHDGVWFLIDQPASAVLAERCQELIGLIGILPQSVHSVRKPTRVDAPLGVIFNYSVHPYSKAAPPLQALRADGRCGAQSRTRGSAIRRRARPGCRGGRGCGRLGHDHRLHHRARDGTTRGDGAGLTRGWRYGGKHGQHHCRAAAHSGAFSCATADAGLLLLGSVCRPSPSLP